MKALNRKERSAAAWRIVSFFVPMLGIVVLGTVLHGKVKRMHLGDLELKKSQYRYALKAQAEKSQHMEMVIQDLTDLRADTKADYLKHQRKQKAINTKLGELKGISLTPKDTATAHIQTIPAIYDSLIKSVQFIQATRDSIKTCEVRNSNLKFQLKECLDALREQLAQEEEEGTP